MILPAQGRVGSFAEYMTWEEAALSAAPIP